MSSWCSTSSWHSRNAGSARKSFAPRAFRWPAKSASESCQSSAAPSQRGPRTSSSLERDDQLSAESGETVQRIEVVDTHTGGEPTRVVYSGGPELGHNSMHACRTRLGVKHDAFRRAVVNVPRGSDVMVGALLLPPVDPACAAGVVFFNNVGYLGMCGH